MNRSIYLITLLLLLFESVFCEVQSYKIFGYVESEDGKPVPYVNIVLLHTDRGTITDQNGYFSLQYSNGDTICLQVQHIGYKAKNIVVPLQPFSNKPLMIYLELNPLQFSPLEIIGNNLLEKQVFIEPSFKVIRRNEIKAVSALDGNDVFRAIQNEPGVNSLNELSNQLYIRGGSPDQNLVLINGAPIYQPFHLFGLASSICGNSIDYVKYSSGGFSAQYGDRMSSVLDVITQPGTDSLTAKMDWNLFSADVAVAGSFGKKMRWRVTGRRSYYDTFDQLFNFEFPYYFYDLETKISYIPREKTLISLSVFFSGDNYSTYESNIYYNPYYSGSSDLSLAHADSNTYFKVSKSGIKWLNKLISMQYHRRFSSVLDNETRFYMSVLDQNYEYLKRFQGHKNASPLTLQYLAKRNEQYNFTTETTDAKTIFADYGGQSLFEYSPEGFYEITTGGGFSYKNLDYSWQNADFNLINRYMNIFMDFPPDSMDYRRNLYNIFGTFEATFKLVRNILNVRLGTRPTWYSHCSGLVLDPRANLAWQVTQNMQLKLGVGKYSQALSMSQEYGFYSVAGIYFPFKDSISSSKHVIFSLLYDNRRNFSTDFSAYYKKFDNLFFINSESQFEKDTGQAFGLETSFNIKPCDWLFGQFAYVYSVVEKTQAAETFYPNYDIRHRVSSRASVYLKKNWQIDLAWNFNTGRPANLYDSPVYSGSDNYSSTGLIGPPEEYLEFYFVMPKNVFRYPAYHRLDVTIKKTWDFRGNTLTGYLQIINVYNRENILYYGDIVEDEVKVVPLWIEPYRFEYHYFKAEAVNGFPFLPTIGVRYEIR